MPLSKNTAEIAIRPMGQADLPALERWLDAPRNRRWWTGPDYVVHLENRMTDTRVRQWIVLAAGDPVAYLQDYDIHAWDAHPLNALPGGARGLDTFLRGEDVMGRGLGPAFLALFSRKCFAEGVPALGIDPHPDNKAAIRCYEKVGFVAYDQRETSAGEILCMRLDPPAAQAQA